MLSRLKHLFSVLLLQYCQHLAKKHEDNNPILYKYLSPSRHWAQVLRLIEAGYTVIAPERKLEDFIVDSIEQIPLSMMMYEGDKTNGPIVGVLIGLHFI